MSKIFHDLCGHLVEEFYGDLHSQLFRTLTYHGRLSAPQLALKSHLPLKQVKAGLSALSQSRLVYHHSRSEAATTYQANAGAAYNLLRIGKLVDLVQGEYGKLAAIIVSETFRLGFATLAEIESRTLDVVSSDQHTLTNGDHASTTNEVKRPRNIPQTLQTLIEAGYLTNLRSAHLQSTFDVKDDAEAHLKQAGQLPLPKGKKAVLEWEAKIDAEYGRRLTTQTVEYGYVPMLSADKRKLMGDKSSDDEGRPSSKKRRLNGESFAKSNGNVISAMAVKDADRAILVYVNFCNLASNTRNIHLADRARKVLGTTHGDVLMAALAQLHVFEERTVNTDENWLDLHEISQEVNRKRTKGVVNGHGQNGLATVNRSNLYDDDNKDGEDRLSYSEVDRSLALLADSEFTFIQGMSSAYGAYKTDWKINKSKLDVFVQQQELLRMMGDRLGLPALRMIRMLIEKGKLDEKTLQEVGLLGAKDLRQTLAQLKQMGFVDLQEVPRESQRQPNRTIFLWFHDSARVRKVLLENLYKAQTRLVQRLKVERRKLSTTLEKIERSDVQGNEEQIMSAAEFKVLRRFQRIEQWLLGELGRLDESVTLLCDL